MHTQRKVYQNYYGELKSTSLIEFVTPSELLSLFELIAPQFNAQSELLYNNKEKPYIAFKLSRKHRIIIKSVDSRWSEDMPSNKFLLLAPICKKGSLTFNDVNKLNRENVDVRFTLYNSKDNRDIYLGLDKLMGLAGGVTVQSIIMTVNEFIFSQKTLHMAFKHNDNEPFQESSPPTVKIH